MCCKRNRARLAATPLAITNPSMQQVFTPIEVRPFLTTSQQPRRVGYKEVKPVIEQPHQTVISRAQTKGLKPAHPSTAPPSYESITQTHQAEIASPSQSLRAISQAGGTLTSPFSEAYSPELSSRGISQAQFITWLDALQRAFTPSPGLQMTCNMMGWIVPGPGHLVSAMIRHGAQTASNNAQRLVLARGNAELFYPAGLQAVVCNNAEVERYTMLSDALITIPFESQGRLGGRSQLRCGQGAGGRRGCGARAARLMADQKWIVITALDLV